MADFPKLNTHGPGLANDTIELMQTGQLGLLVAAISYETNLKAGLIDRIAMESYA
jgi:hypothetical protein